MQVFHPWPRLWLLGLAPPSLWQLPTSRHSAMGPENHPVAPVTVGTCTQGARASLPGPALPSIPLPQPAHKTECRIQGPGGSTTQSTTWDTAFLPGDTLSLPPQLASTCKCQLLAWRLASTAHCNHCQHMHTAWDPKVHLTITATTIAHTTLAAQKLGSLLTCTVHCYYNQLLRKPPRGPRISLPGTANTGASVCHHGAQGYTWLAHNCYH